MFNLSENVSVVTNRTGPPIASIICGWITLMVLIFPALVLSIVTCLSSFNEKSLPKVIRITIVNILAACLTVGVSGAMKNIAVLIVGYNDSIPKSDVFCRFFTWIYLAGVAGRLTFMALLAISVFVLIRSGKSKKYKIILLVTVVFVWLFILLYSSSVFSESVLKVFHIEDTTCSPRLNRTYAGYLMLLGYFIMFAIISYAITIVVAVQGIRFVKRHIVTEDSGPKRALTKFCLFLLFGNTISLLGQVVPIVVATLNIQGNVGSEITAQYIQSLVIYTSLYPTPLLIIIYFSPIRRKIIRIISCGRLYKIPEKREKIASGQILSGTQHSTLPAHPVSHGQNNGNTDTLKSLPREKI